MKRLASFFILTAFMVLPVFAQYAPQFGTTLALSDDHLFVGEGRNLLLPGNVFVYTQAADGSWTQAEVLMPPDAQGEALGFGRALAVSGSTLAVGAPTGNAVYLYERNADGTWSQTDKLSNAAAGFGANVALDGDHLLVAASGDRETAGGVHAYRRGANGTWEAAGTLAADSIDVRDGYGRAIALRDGYAVVAAPMKESRAGAVYAFAYDAGTGGWEATGMLPHEVESGDQFGAALLLTDTHLVVGMPGHERSGAVVLFRKEGGADTWTYERRLAPFDAEGGEAFGASLVHTGDQLWVGAPGYGERGGQIYQFQPDPSTGRMAGTWPLEPAGLQYRSSYGTAMASNGEATVVGAPGHDNFEGVVFPYAKTASGWTPSSPLYNDEGEFVSATGDMVECEEGAAGAFDCSNVDMVSFLTRHEVGAKRGIQVNDVWGWEDLETGREYALVGRTDGTSFIDLTDPEHPVYVGDLPMTEGANQSIWRDVKVYKDHAFIVSDGAGPHHLQVFDLRQLRDVQNTPVTFEETALYKGIYSAHNIIINEDTGFAYAVGADSGGETCGGALHMINIQDPKTPTFAGCFADPRTGRGRGATHDAQCVVYHGPDDDFQGREICLSSNGNALSIADVTDKDNPVAISIAEYPSVAYTHQGWLTEDHRYFYLNDEGDEASELVDGTRTLIFDLAELDEPVLAGEYRADHNAIDHNLYIKGNLMYQTNYVAGLRILDISDPENPTEVGYFDTVPYGKNDNSPVLGAWSNYPYFKSGVIVVTSGREGVFFLKKKQVDL